MIDLVERLRTSWDVDRSIISQTSGWDKERKEAADEITVLRARLEEVEKERDEAIIAMSDQARLRGKAEGRLLASELAGIVEGWKARAEAAEAALATARRDALEEVLHLMPRYFGVWSSTGVHIGVWDDGATAAKVLEEYTQGVMRDLIDVETIRALIAQEDAAQKEAVNNADTD